MESNGILNFLCFHCHLDLFVYMCACCAYRPLDLVVHPVRQPCQRLGFIQQTPKRSPVYLASSSLLKGSHHSPSRTVELHVLETPFVVKVSIIYLMFIVKLGSSHLSHSREK